MSLLDNFLTALDKIPEEQAETKTVLKELFQNLNKERGEALTDLNTYKGEATELKQKTGELEKNQASYKTLVDTLKAMNVSIEDADKVAEQLKIKKTDEDKMSQLTEIAEKAQNELKEANDKLRNIEIKDKMEPRLEKAINEFKDKDGNPIKLVKEFIDDKALYNSSLDLDNDVLVNDTITKALSKGYENQVAFAEKTGAIFDDKTVHKVPTDGEGHFNKEGNRPDLTQAFKTVREEGGSLDAVARVLDAAQPLNQ